MSFPKATLISTRSQPRHVCPIQGRGCFWLFPQLGTRLLGLGLLQKGESEAGGPVRPRGKFVLQWSPPGVERVADIVVQEAAQRRHVDVGKPGQASQEVGWVLVCAEQASKLGVEETFGHFPEEEKRGTTEKDSKQSVLNRNRFSFFTRLILQERKLARRAASTSNQKNSLAVHHPNDSDHISC